VSLPESAELARLVRDARPRPREAFTAALDARVAAGFPREKKRREELRVHRAAHSYRYHGVMVRRRAPWGPQKSRDQRASK